MATLTVPHTAEDDWGDLMEGLKKAWSFLLNSKGWRRFCRLYGMSGTLRVFDCTFGRNGFHLHWHVALFPTLAGRVVDLEMQPITGMNKENREFAYGELTAELRPLWEAACVAVGILPDNKVQAFREHGVDLRGATYAAAYFTKWGMGEELALGTMKSRNQWSLLDESAAGDRSARDKFVRFYWATKGTAVLTGLKALRKKLNLTDEEVDEHEERRKEQLEAELLKEGKEIPEPGEDIKVTVAPWLYDSAVRLGWWRLMQVSEKALGRGEK